MESQQQIIIALFLNALAPKMIIAMFARMLENLQQNLRGMFPKAEVIN
jgi:hypothetical protein